MVLLLYHSLTHTDVGATTCVTSDECKCRLPNPETANSEIVVPWPANDCNQCVLLNTDSISLECQHTQTHEPNTFQVGFWVPASEDIGQNTVATCSPWLRDTPSCSKRV